jgi:hypothetical protein
MQVPPCYAEHLALSYHLGGLDPSNHGMETNVSEQAYTEPERIGASNAYTAKRFRLAETLNAGTT